MDGARHDHFAQAVADDADLYPLRPDTNTTVINLIAKHVQSLGIDLPYSSTAAPISNTPAIALSRIAARFLSGKGSSRQ